MLQFTAFIFLVLTAVDCSVQSNQELLITRNKNKTNCYDYFSISPALEPDSSSARQLSGYLYRSLVGAVQCRQDTSQLKNIFSRPSFEKALYLFFLNPEYVKLNHYETTSQWIEGYDDLIRNCSDSLMAYRISDSLLHYNMDNGLRALWNNGHLTRLRNFDRYINNCIKSGRLYGVLESIVILHNVKEYEARDKLLKKTSGSKEYQSLEGKLEKLLSDNGFIDYELFMEVIYGGV